MVIVISFTFEQTISFVENSCKEAEDDGSFTLLAEKDTEWKCSIRVKRGS